MATLQTIPMFDPTGKVRDVPAAMADAAQKAGGKLAVKMTDPKGTQRWVPKDMVPQALKAGGKMVTGTAPAPWQPTRYLPQQPQTRATVQAATGPEQPHKFERFAKGTPASGKAEYYAEDLSHKVLEPAAPYVAAGVLAPAAAGVAGAAGAGALVSGLAGAVGAGVGGAAGTKAQGKSTGEAVKVGAEQAALEFVGGTLAPTALRATVPIADRTMARILGVTVTKKTPTAESIRKIGNIVNKYVGGSATLNRLADKITTTKEGFNTLTEKIVQRTPGAKLVPWDSIVYDNGMKAIDEAEAFNRGTKTIDELVDTLSKKFPGNATPKDMLEIRRTLLKEKDPVSGQTQWPAGTKQFRTMLYHDLNRAIQRALPPKEAAQFAENNYRISKLIMAEEAITKKQARREAGQAGESILGRVARSPIAWGAGVGAGEGVREKRSLGGAVEGALVVGGLTAAGSSTAAKSLAIKAARNLAPGAAAVSQASPEAIRAQEAIRAIQSQPQNQP